MHLKLAIGFACHLQQQPVLATLPFAKTKAQTLVKEQQQQQQQRPFNGL